ncbi:MAG: DUF2235 domain-containing protein [Pseudomonadota bacterium]
MDGSGARQARNLVFISDGTLSSDEPGARSNAGILAGLLGELGPTARQCVLYDRGVQGRGIERWVNAATGLGLDYSIRDGYAFLASRYRPGDRIFLLGYSRGAYAVRLLAGMIGDIGLLRAEDATERHVTHAFRGFLCNERVGGRAGRRRFREAHCHTHVPIEMLGAWDTVRALGLPLPGFSWLAPLAARFRNDALPHHVRHGYQALALDEDRLAFRPRLWKGSTAWQGRLEQAWFPGSHGDVGGEVRHWPAARPLANIPLNWMLRRAERHGLALPDGWEDRFVEDAAAESSSDRSLLGRAFVLRRPRRTGRGDGEALHMSVRERIAAMPAYAARHGAGRPEITVPPHPILRADGIAAPDPQTGSFGAA